MAYEKLVISSNAVPMTPGVFGQSRVALLRLENADIRYRIDGTSPTASDGILLKQQDILMLRDPLLIKLFSAIAVSDDAVAHVAYLEDNTAKMWHVPSGPSEPSCDMLCDAIISGYTDGDLAVSAGCGNSALPAWSGQLKHAGWSTYETAWLVSNCPDVSGYSISGKLLKPSSTLMTMGEFYDYLTITCAAADATVWTGRRNHNRGSIGEYTRVSGTDDTSALTLAECDWGTLDGGDYRIKNYSDTLTMPNYVANAEYKATWPGTFKARSSTNYSAFGILLASPGYAGFKINGKALCPADGVGSASGTYIQKVAGSPDEWRMKIFVAAVRSGYYGWWSRVWEGTKLWVDGDPTGVYTRISGSDSTPTLEIEACD